VTPQRAYEARATADARSADSATEVGGGVWLRTPSLPDIWDLNVAMLGPGATDADVEAACGLELRRVTLFRDHGGPFPPGFSVDRCLLMVHDGGPVEMPDGVAEVDFRALGPARRRAHGADHLDQIEAMHERQAAAGARTFAHGETAWSVLANGCVDDVFVVEEARGRGLGRAVTAAAVAQGGWFLWCLEDDPRPQALYRSLGFGVAGRVVQLTRGG
jgi:GNAT superfamily N-acetyltransferase